MRSTSELCSSVKPFSSCVPCELAPSEAIPVRPGLPSVGAIYGLEAGSDGLLGGVSSDIFNMGAAPLCPGKLASVASSCNGGSSFNPKDADASAGVSPLEVDSESPSRLAAVCGDLIGLELLRGIPANINPISVGVDACSLGDGHCGYFGLSLFRYFLRDWASSLVVEARSRILAVLIIAYS